MINCLVQSLEPIAAILVHLCGLFELLLVALQFGQQILRGFAATGLSAVLLSETVQLFFVVLETAVDLLAVLDFGRELTRDTGFPLNHLLDNIGLVGSVVG